MNKFITWIKKKIWWRKYYKRVTDYDIAWRGRCLECPAASGEIQCNMKDHPCPCKWNQCLKLKKL